MHYIVHLNIYFLNDCIKCSNIFEAVTVLDDKNETNDLDVVLCMYINNSVLLTLAKEILTKHSCQASQKMKIEKRLPVVAIVRYIDKLITIINPWLQDNSNNLNILFLQNSVTVLCIYNLRLIN